MHKVYHREDRKTAAPAAKAAAAARPASADAGKEQNDVHTQRLAGPVANKMHASSVDWTIDRTVEPLMASCSPGFNNTARARRYYVLI